MRIDAYANFLGSAQTLADSLNPGHTKQERDDRGAEVLVAQSRVAILHASDDVLDRAYDVVVALTKKQRKKYRDSAEAFRDAARDEIAETGVEPEER